MIKRKYIKPLLAFFCRTTLNDEENNRILIITENIISDKHYVIKNNVKNQLLHKSGIIIGSRLKNDSNIERLLCFLELFRFRYMGSDKSMSKYYSYYLSLLPKANSEEDYVSILKHFPNIAPETISELLMKAPASQRIHLFHAVCMCEFETNISHYNIVIKALNYEDGFLLINEMINRNIVPDTEIIKSLLKKWTTIEELFNIIRLASYYEIQSNDCNNAIYFRCQKISLQNELLAAIYDNRFDCISAIWIKQLRRIGKGIKSKL